MRLTEAEKKARADVKEKQRVAREEKKKATQDKLAAAAAEKSQKKKEREEKKAVADAEKHARDMEREAKRAKKEEEERKAKQEKEKKERSQLRLNSFFKVPVSSAPKVAKPTEEAKSSATPAAVPDAPAQKDTPLKASAYDKLFKPFYVKAGMRLAVSPFEMDEETMSAKSRILDEYISGRRGDLESKTFNPVEAFSLVSKPKPRGMLHEPVKATIERLRVRTQQAEARGDIEEQEQAQRDARRRLAKVNMKSIRFQQDVRPAYLGTITQVPHDVGLPKMRKMARKPIAPILPLNYDYDSEAEWQEEEGEDLDGDDEDEEDLEDGDEVGELIDDSEAVDLMRFGATSLEPLSTGICWEDNKRKTQCPTAHNHRLEFIFTGTSAANSLTLCATNMPQMASGPPTASTHSRPRTGTRSRPLSPSPLPQTPLSRSPPPSQHLPLSPKRPRPENPPLTPASRPVCRTRTSPSSKRRSSRHTRRHPPYPSWACLSSSSLAGSRASRSTARTFREAMSRPSSTSLRCVRRRPAR